jgi:hypothetical protein
MQTRCSETLIGWKSGKTTCVPLWDRMERAWLWTQVVAKAHGHIFKKKCVWAGKVGDVRHGMPSFNFVIV